MPPRSLGGSICGAVLSRPARTLAIITVAAGQDARTVEGFGAEAVGTRAPPPLRLGGARRPPPPEQLE